MLDIREVPTHCECKHDDCPCKTTYIYLCHSKHNQLPQLKRILADSCTIREFDERVYFRLNPEPRLSLYNPKKPTSNPLSIKQIFCDLLHCTLLTRFGIKDQCVHYDTLTAEKYHQRARCFCDDCVKRDCDCESVRQHVLCDAPAALDVEWLMDTGLQPSLSAGRWLFNLARDSSIVIRDCRASDAGEIYEEFCDREGTVLGVRVGKVGGAVRFWHVYAGDDYVREDFTTGVTVESAAVEPTRTPVTSGVESPKEKKLSVDKDKKRKRGSGTHA